MFAPSDSLVSRAARYLFAGADEPALWAVSVHGRVVGSLVCQSGRWRLSWFEGADPRLASFAGPPTGDVETLAAALSARLASPVRIESLPV